MSDVFRVRVREKATGRYLDPPKAEASRTSYEAASTAPRVARWQGNGAGPTTSITRDLPKLRARSRDRRRNDGVADSAIEIMTANVIGTGIKPQWRTPDRELNKALTDLWLNWTDFSDPGGQMDFYGQQAAAFAGMMEGGEIFARLRTRRVADGLPVPLQVQLLESEHCPVEKTESYGSARIVNGIEFNPIGQRAAYWLYREHPGDQNFLFNSDGNMPLRVPAAEIVHLAGVRRLSNVRGEPWLTRALMRMYDLDQTDDALVMRMKIGNLFAGFIKPSAEGKFSWSDESGNVAADATVDGGGRALATLEPGLMQVLGPGEDVTFASPPEAGSSYEAFNKIQMRKIAASVGLTYEQLSGDFSGVNDRTWRSAMNEFHRRLEKIQLQLVAFQFCRPICQRFVELAILNGLIKIPAGMDESKVLRPAWIAPVRPYINPVQDVQANVAEVTAGFKSRTQVVSERGVDVEELDEEIQRDMEREEKLDLSFTTSVGAAAPPAPAAPGQPDPNDPNNPDAKPEEDPKDDEEDDKKLKPEDVINALSDAVRAVAERPAPPINVSVAAPHIDVHAHIPKRGEVVKKITAYDDQNRPVEMTETEKED